MQAALLITLYQDEPVLNQASRLLRAIVDIDELMTVKIIRLQIKTVGPIM
jgi:hypothetical protein